MTNRPEQPRRASGEARRGDGSGPTDPTRPDQARPVTSDDDIAAEQVGGTVSWGDGNDTIHLPHHVDLNQAESHQPDRHQPAPHPGHLPTDRTGAAATPAASRPQPAGPTIDQPAPSHNGHPTPQHRLHPTSTIPPFTDEPRSPESAAARGRKRQPPASPYAGGRSGRSARRSVVPPAQVLDASGLSPKAWASRSRRTKRRAIIASTLVLCALGVVAVLAAAFWQAQQARTELQAAQAATADVQIHLRALDIVQARESVSEVQQHTQRARQLAGGFPLGAIQVLPGVGDDAKAAEAAAIAVDDLATEVMPTLIDVATSMDPEQLAPQDGRVELAPVVQSQQPLTQASQNLDRILADVQAIDLSGVDARIATQVEALHDEIEQTASTTQDARDIATVLPGMLGADGPRNILVLFQNNAEIRTRGGVPSAGALVRTDGGKISLVDQFSSRTIGTFNEPVQDLGQMEAVHGARLGQFIQDVNLTPHFPATAELARNMWAKRKGSNPEDIAAVVAMDPVVLSYLLADGSSVEVPGGQTLTADNATSVLMNEIYLTTGDSKEMDQFFAAAAAASFDKVLTSGSGRQTIDALRKAISENRFLVWSADGEEEAVLTASPVGGAFDAAAVGDSKIGIFLNGGTASKLGYYVNQEVETTPWCAAGIGTVPGTHVRMKLTSTAPGTVAEAPAYLAGTGKQGVPPGTEKLLVMFYGPKEASFDGITINGEQAAVSITEEHGLKVAVVTVVLPPGEQADLDLFVSGVSFDEHSVVLTPLVSESKAVRGDSCKS